MKYLAEHPELEGEEVDWFSVALDENWFPHLTRCNNRYVANNAAAIASVVLAILAMAAMYFASKIGGVQANKTVGILAIFAFVSLSTTLFFTLNGKRLKKKYAATFEKEGFELE